jgi:nucleotide-binding universal stress UspA family protein
MRDTRRQRVLVGVSRSAGSRAALRWAAEEARLRHATMHVVRVWDPARHAAPYAAPGSTPTGEEERDAARDGLAAALRATFGHDRPADVVVELAEGVPERALIDRSADADLLVLGQSQPPWMAGRSAGPVVRACLEHARCAVVVVSAADPVPAGRPLADASV